MGFQGGRDQTSRRTYEGYKNPQVHALRILHVPYVEWFAPCSCYVGHPEKRNIFYLDGAIHSAIHGAVYGLLCVLRAVRKNEPMSLSLSDRETFLDVDTNG